MLTLFVKRPGLNNRAAILNKILHTNVLNILSFEIIVNSGERFGSQLRYGIKYELFFHNSLSS